MKIEHDGIEITYREKENDWFFELRNRERTAPSLAEAKRIIDTPAKSAKESTFERFEAWVFGNYSGSDIAKGTVTSQAVHRYGNPRYWVTTADKKRSTYDVESIFPCNEENDKLIAEIQTLNAQRDALAKRRDVLRNKLTSLRHSALR